MVILAHHEIFMQLIQYVLVLILGGWICFKHLFPMIGRWIVNLNRKLQNRIAKLKADEDKWKADQIKSFEAGQLTLNGRYVDCTGGRSTYSKRWIQEEQPGTEEFFATESQNAKVLSKKADPHSVSWKELRKREAQRRADDKCVIDGLYMDENDIKSCYEDNGFPKTIKQREEPDDDNPICAPWLGQPK